jgi:hypothetical protein
MNAHSTPLAPEMVRRVRRYADTRFGVSSGLRRQRRVMTTAATNMEHNKKTRPTTHQHTPEEERAIREAALDHTIAESFPASDPLSSDPNPDDHSAVAPDAAESEVDS